MTTPDALLDACVDAIRASSVTIALTGAGISVDSGIPDFRSPGGLWDQFDPMEYATIEAFMADPEKVWTMLFAMMDVMDRARPNAGHVALAELERLGFLDAVITQNIDNLHQDAGSRHVIEFHGNSSRLMCPRCLVDYDARHFEGLKRQRPLHPPLCEDCGAVLKPDVVLFGESIPERAARDSALIAGHCDLMLVIGTSALVYPAAGLPTMAKSRGARIIEINLEPTPLTGTFADWSIQESSTVVLPEILRRLTQNNPDG